MSNLHNTKQEGRREGGCITIWPVKIWGKRITLGEGDGGPLFALYAKEGESQTMGYD